MVALALATLTTLTVSACAAEEMAEAQVVALVNGRPITVAQVQHWLGAPNGLPIPPLTGSGADAALEQLIDEELLVQGALSQGIERRPAVTQLLEAERRRILAMSYLEEAVQTAPGEGTPSAAEIADFFAEHPELFSQRRIYQMRELFVVATPEQAREVEAQAGQSASLAEIADWLRTRGFTFRETAGTWPAERLPYAVLELVSGMGATDIRTVVAPEVLMVMQLVAATAAPLSFEEARPIIEDLLALRWRSEAASATLRRLRDAARIEYPGRAAEGPHEPLARAQAEEVQP